jgi:hypothetical protein
LKIAASARKSARAAPVAREIGGINGEAKMAYQHQANGVVAKQRKYQRNERQSAAVIGKSKKRNEETA